MGTGARGAKWGVEMTLKREKLLGSLVVERGDRMGKGKKKIEYVRL